MAQCVYFIFRKMSFVKLHDPKRCKYGRMLTAVQMEIFFNGRNASGEYFPVFEDDNGPL
jgi:hypothetical protein